jgi:hypothetical protein
MTKSNKKLLISIILNLLIVGFEIIGAILSLKRRGIEAFLFYTELTNYITLIISSIYVVLGIIALKNSSSTPNWLNKTRYASTVGLILTFMVVLCILVPITPSEFGFYLFGDSNLYQHFICPILAVVSYLFFENNNKLKKTTLWYGVFPTLMYGLILISLNACKIIVGPYPFFYVYDFPWYVTTLLLSGILTLTFFVSWMVLTVYNKHNKNYSSKTTIQR